MKLLLLRFAESLLSREQMNKVRGGYAASVTATCLDGSSVACSGSSCWSVDESSSTAGYCGCIDSVGDHSGQICN